MKRIARFFLVFSILVFTVLPAVAQSDLEHLLPVYPGATIRSYSTENDERLVVTTPDDPKAVMIFYRKRLVYGGWQVLSGSVLWGDRTIIFTSDSKRLTMQAGEPSGEFSRILFTLTD